jgi:FlaA1/EpsC-like NDP-sugar epimerase
MLTEQFPWASLLDRPEVRFDELALHEALAGRRLLVVGAGGSVGTALTETLAGFDPAELVLLESHEPSLFHLRGRVLAARPGLRARWALGDVRDERRIAALFRECRPEIVFHLAACKHVPLSEENVDQAISVNVLGTIGLLHQAAEAGATAFVYPSTDKAVNPPSIYGATKRVLERYFAEYARTHDSPLVRWVRLVNVLGTQGSVIETFARQILAGDPLTITDRRMSRYWMTMRETARLLAWAATTTTSPGPFVLDCGADVPLEETARKVARVVRPGYEPTLRSVGIRPGERLSEYLAYDYEALVDSGQPGVHAIRDARGDAARSPELVQQIADLGATLYETDRAGLRRRLFALASEER